MYEHVSDKNKICLSVGSSGNLSVIVVCLCLRSSLCRGLEYLLKAKVPILF